jgi:hypothetical protein
VEKGDKPLADIAAARTGLEMIVAPFESRRQGKPVPIPLASRQDPLASL